MPGFGWSDERMTSTKLTLVAVGLAALLLVAGTAAAIPNQAADQAQTQSDSKDDHGTNAAQDESDAGADTANATPANTTDDESPADHAGDRARDRNRTQESQPASEAGKAEGPPVDMPAQVPDHVTRIHETIRSFLAGDVDGSLGDAISDIVPFAGSDGQGPSNSARPTGVGR